MKSLVIIGYGNLANSIVKGFANSTLKEEYIFYVCGRDLEKAQKFAQSFSDLSIQATPNLEIFKENKPIILLCVKPKGLENFSFNFPTALVYSVMAGVSIEQIQANFPKALILARAMPNIGASVQCSCTCVYFQINDENIQSYDAQSLLTKITEAFGKAIFVENESLIDSSIAPSGSSPAFLSLVAEALIDAGVREGFSASASVELVKATFQGFSKLLEQYSPQEIKTLVTSPAGATAEGLIYLEKRGFKGILQEAGHQAVLKAKGKI